MMSAPRRFRALLSLFLASFLATASCFTTPSPLFGVRPSSASSRSSSSSSASTPTTGIQSSSEPIVSPFDNTADDAAVATSASYSPTDAVGEETLELTWENVDLVLEEMRPYLIQDGGNVAISDIDGPVVRLELQGACGTCPSSTQTMKMGLERRLRERIPEIQDVVQSMPEGPPLELAQVEVILDGVRPFLQVAGGSIECSKIEGEGSTQPGIFLRMQGSSASLSSVKLEIAQRLQRHFMMSGLRVEWEE